MAECVYETKGDYFNAIDCARRAVGLDEQCIEARVIVSRILLESCQLLWSTDRGKVSMDSVVDLDISNVLATPFQSLSKDGQQVILQLFQSTDNNRCISGVLLAVFQFMPAHEVTKVCGDVVSISQTHQPSLIHLILFTSLMLLSPVTIEYIAIRNNARLNEYRLWLFLDAVVTTAGIYESIGDIQKTREIGYTLLSAAVQTNSSSSDRHRMHFGYGFLADTFESCRNTILALACRLPLLERSSGLVDEAIGSFHRCISGGSPLRHYFPIPIQLGLNVEAALTLLMRGKNIQENEGGVVVEYGSNSSKSHVSSVTRDIDHAYSLLSTAQQVECGIDFE